MQAGTFHVRLEAANGLSRPSGFDDCVQPDAPLLSVRYLFRRCTAVHRTGSRGVVALQRSDAGTTGLRAPNSRSFGPTAHVEMLLRFLTSPLCARLRTPSQYFGDDEQKYTKTYESGNTRVLSVVTPRERTCLLRLVLTRMLSAVLVRRQEAADGAHSQDARQHGCFRTALCSCS